MYWIPMDLVSYSSERIMLIISNWLLAAGCPVLKLQNVLYLPGYSLNCSPLGPINITNNNYTSRRGGTPKKVLYGEAPPRGPTPYPFI